MILKAFNRFFILSLAGSSVLYAQDTVSHKTTLNRSLAVSIGLSHSKMFGTMIDRQARNHNETHKGDPGFLISVTVQSEMSKRLYAEYGIELITKKSEYFIPTHYFPAKASTTFVSVPVGLGFRLINKDDFTFQISSGLRLNFVSSSEDNLKRGVLDTYFYKYTYESYLTSFYFSPQIKFKIKKNVANPLLLFVIDCCCGSPDPQRGIICGSSY
jgi:hypothetical protein